MYDVGNSFGCVTQVTFVHRTSYIVHSFCCIYKRLEYSIMKKFFFCTATSLSMAAAAFAQSSPQPFVKGDRVAFVGNSITDGGHYHSFIWLYYMTRFPNARIDVFNCGIGGDVAEQIYRRLDDDVFSHKPTVISLTFGMNDTKYYEYLKPDADEISKQAVQTSFDSYKKIEQKLLALPNAKKVLVASSPYDETVKLSNNYFPKKSLAMLKVADFQKEAAQKNNWSFVDFNRPMTALNIQGQKTDSTFTLCGGDRIHPDNNGHMIMAYIFLKAQGLAGKEVATVSIDASGKKLEKAGNCTVSNLNAGDGKVTFDYLAKALPYPIDTMARGWGAKHSQAEALTLVPFTEEFNKEMLQVKGLSANANYTLKIDGATVGSWTGSQLAAGVNLAVVKSTPQYQQAETIMILNEERWEIERRLRQYAWMEFSGLYPRGLLFKDNQATVDTLERAAKNDWAIAGNIDNYRKARFPEVREAWKKEMATLVNEIYVLNQPKKRKIELVKQ